MYFRNEPQFYNKQRIQEIAEIAQKNFENPGYDHSSKKWLSEEEEKELMDLLAEGFEDWRKSEYYAFLQGCVEYGPTAYREIANMIQSKTEEEVKEYSEVFWTRGKLLLLAILICRELIPDFQKIQQKVTQQASFREEAEHYQEYAALKVLMQPSPLELDLPGTRSTVFPPEADIFIVMGIAAYGWGQWSRIRQLLNSYIPFQYDYLIRLKSDSEIARRAEVLMKALKKEREEVAARQETLKRQWNQEKEALQLELIQITKNKEQMRQQIHSNQLQIQELQKQVAFIHEQQFNHRLRLSDFNLDQDIILKLIPICEILRGGVLANQSELERFIRGLVPLSYRVIEKLVMMFAEKERGSRNKFVLRNLYWNKERNCVDFSCDLTMTEMMQSTCLECAKKTEENGGLHVTDIKALLQQEEAGKQKKVEKLLSVMKERKFISINEIYSEEFLNQVGMTKSEMISLAPKYLVWTERVFIQTHT